MGSSLGNTSSSPTPKTASHLPRETLDATRGRERYDECCKALLSERAVLAWILKGCLEEFADMGIEAISACIQGDPERSTVLVAPGLTNTTRVGISANDKVPGEGEVGFDIIFRVALPGTSDEEAQVIVNVEGQTDFSPGYPIVNRGVYYCSRMLSAQYGRTFTHAHYEKLQKVYSIWICPVPPVHLRGVADRCRLETRRMAGPGKPEQCNLVTVITAYPWRDTDAAPACASAGNGSAKPNAESSMLGFLGTLFASKVPTSEKRRILEEDYGVEVTPTFARKVEDMGTGQTGDWHFGHEEGFAEGLEQGLEQARLDTVRNLMQSWGFTIDQALDAAGVPPEEINRFRELIGQVRSPSGPA